MLIDTKSSTGILRLWVLLKSSQGQLLDGNSKNRYEGEYTLSINEMDLGSLFIW